MKRRRPTFALYQIPLLQVPPSQNQINLPRRCNVLVRSSHPWPPSSRSSKKDPHKEREEKEKAPKK